MDLKNYFDHHQGLGVLATSNSSGVVDTALYATPHMLDQDTVAFIMRDRLSHANLQENGHASYLFVEEGKGYQGIRLFLSHLDESSDPELLEQLSRRQLSPEQNSALGPRYLVRFKVNQVLNLVGGHEPEPSH